MQFSSYGLHKVTDKIPNFFYLLFKLKLKLMGRHKPDLFSNYLSYSYYSTN